MVTKHLLQPLSRSLLSAFFIPGGVFFGGLYMMWLALARGMVAKPGSATLAAFVQAGVNLLLGLSPILGVLSLFVYLLPGIFIDLVFLLPGQAALSRLARFTLACLGANVIGIVSVALVWGIGQRPLILLAAVGALSGAAGGLMAFFICEKMPSRALHTSV